MLKFKEEVLGDLKKIFENEELEIINLLLEGKAKVNSIKKAHLETFRKMIAVLSNELNWSGSVSEVNSEIVAEDQDETISVVQEEFNALSAVCLHTVQGNNSEIMTEVHRKKETCKALESGKCQHGWSGKKPDQQGKICSFMHPKVCKKQGKIYWQFKWFEKYSESFKLKHSTYYLTSNWDI